MVDLRHRQPKMLCFRYYIKMSTVYIRVRIIGMGNTVDKLHPEWVDNYNKLKCVSDKMFS